MKIHDIINETMSGSIATVATGLGSGSEASRSVYPTTRKKKKEKSTIIRRIPKND